MAKVIEVKEGRCVGCGTCVIECALAHSPAETLAGSLSAETPPQSRVHVEPVAGGGRPMQCRHCPDAPCIAVCPKEAMTRADAEAPVQVDPEKCIGCKFCMVVCPYGAIDLLRSTEKKKVVKCDLCVERTAEGALPACVAGCPVAAMAFVELDDDVRQRRQEEAARVASDQAAHAGELDEEEKKVTCEVCGVDVAPRKQLELLRGKLPEDAVVPNVCPRCRRARAAVLLARETLETVEK